MTSTVIIICAFFGASVRCSGDDSLQRPNIILINLDDADADLFRPDMLQAYYPHLQQLAQSGIQFKNLHVTTPFCAPSRAALFRGQYAFSTGIKVNNPDGPISNGFSGGYGEFVSRGYDTDELGVWMRNAGYKTMHVGKFHHHNFDNRVPSGWDEFRMTAGNRYYGGYRFSNQNDPQGGSYQTGPDDYVTIVDGDEAVELIEGQYDDDQPFFLYVAPIAPHLPNSFVPEDMVELRYREFAANEVLDDSPDLYEADMSDKPRHLRFTTPEHWKDFLERAYISRVRAVKSVDDLVGRIVAAVDSIGATGSTFILFTSDNGYQLGHHNLHNKSDPFQRTTNVPLIVKGPGIPAGRTADHLLAHIDICPTILDLAGAAIPASVEANSFYPLLFEPDHHEETSWQDGILIENWAKKANFGDRVLGSYVAYRKHHEIFVSWANGLYEYYDLNEDPYQLDNAYASLTTPQIQAFKRSIRRFRTHRIDPITTLDSNFTDAVHSRRVRIRGFSEDDAGVFGVLLTVRSFETQRYWNGTDWQDSWFGHQLPVKNPNQPISTWKYNAEIFTETPSGNDFLIFTYRTFGAHSTLPSTVNFHVNEIDAGSPVADFDDGLDRQTFSGVVELSGSQFDANHVAQTLLTIRRAGTGDYFTGDGFQPDRFEIPADMVSDNRWRYLAVLPDGDYRGGIRAIDVAGNRQHPAESVRFSVQND